MLAQPSTLKKIGHLLAQNDVKSRKSRVYRLLIGAENTSGNECTVVGVESPCTSGFQSPNTFAKLFEMALRDQEDVEVVHEWFDSDCLRIARCSFLNFVSMVNGAAERLYEHEELLSRLLEEEKDQDQGEDQDRERQDQNQDKQDQAQEGPDGHGQGDGQESADENDNSGDQALG